MNPSFAPPKQYWGYSLDQLQNTDLRGQSALVTGANSGIGYEISKALSRQGAMVTMACRNPQKCFEAAERIQNESQYSGAAVSPLIMDVSSLKSVQSAAETFLLRNEKLDMLFLNAGIYTAGKNFDGSPLPLSNDGIEMVFATNVVGHHLLYRLMEPILLKSAIARVVLTSSFMSFNSFDHGVATDLATLNSGDSSFPHSIKVYGQSKLAQISLVKSITQRLQNENISNVYINAANPGIVRTPMQYKHSNGKSNPAFVNAVVKWFQDRQTMWTAEEGALTPLFLGVAINEMHEKNIRGKLYSPVGMQVDPPYLDEVMQDKLWLFCEDLVKYFMN